MRGAKRTVNQIMLEVSGVVLEEEYDEEREIKITTVRIGNGERGEDDGKTGGNISYIGSP